MTHILNTNSPNLRLESLYVGLNTTLRVGLPNISQIASNVQIFVTYKNVTNAYLAIWDDESKMWVLDVEANQFYEIGKQSFEVYYDLDNKPFNDGKGWIIVVDAVVEGVIPQPTNPSLPRYVVLSVNGVHADANGNVQIPLSELQQVLSGQSFQVDTARQRADALSAIITALGGTVL